MRQVTQSGFFSPQASRVFRERMSLSPMRMGAHGKNAIRIVESGELRVVNKAAKQHWDFQKHNPQQLKQHIHELRFMNGSGIGYDQSTKPLQHVAQSMRSSRVMTGERNESPLRKGHPIDESAILIKIGLSNYNTPSVENLSRDQSDFATTNKKLFEHNLREGAPQNHLGPIDNKSGSVITNYKTQNGNFGAAKKLTTSHQESKLEDLRISRELL